MSGIDLPIFDGQPIFGDLPSLQIQELVQGRALDVDNWLGLTTGTTQYGADPSGGVLWGIAGAWIATSEVAVAVLEATLLSFAGITAAFGRPTGLPWPGNFVPEPNCYFVLGEVVVNPGWTVAIGGGMYSLSYTMVIRQIP